MSETSLQLAVGLLIAFGAVAVVLLPTLRAGRAPRAARTDGLDGGRAGRGNGGARPDPGQREEMERRIAEYREALTARTVCERCLFANPPGSAFCAWCGRSLAEDAS